MGCGSDGAACLQVLYLMVGCLGLHQSIGVPLELEASCTFLDGAEMGWGEAQDMPWGLGPRGWCSLARIFVIHIFFKLLWMALLSIGSPNVRGKAVHREILG